MRTNICGNVGTGNVVFEDELLKKHFGVEE